jgi:hypothetical protein
MATESQPRLGTMAFNTLLMLALGCGIQALTAPTVTVSCPARTSTAPDCHLRWLIAFDTLPVRRTPLPALTAADQVEAVGASNSRTRGAVSASTFYLRTAAGRVRVILWGEQIELQTFRLPIVKYLADEHAPALDVTMWPSWAPWRPFASVVIGLGLLQGAIVIVRLVRGTRPSS